MWQLPLYTDNDPMTVYGIFIENLMTQQPNGSLG